LESLGRQLETLSISLYRILDAPGKPPPSLIRPNDRSSLWPCPPFILFFRKNKVPHTAPPILLFSFPLLVPVSSSSPRTQRLADYFSPSLPALLPPLKLLESDRDISRRRTRPNPLPLNLLSCIPLPCSFFLPTITRDPQFVSPKDHFFAMCRSPSNFNTAHLVFQPFFLFSTLGSFLLFPKPVILPLSFLKNLER